MKQVIFDKAGGEPHIVDTEVPVPQDDQLLVKSLWTAMNPIDAMAANYGVLVDSWPIGLGADASGLVEEAGKTAADKYGFKKGDYVCGCTRLGNIECNTAREFYLMDAQTAMRKPSNLSTTEAATVGAGFQTACLGLFELGLKLPLPEIGNKKSMDEWVLVLGGAGSVGRAAVQLATAAGFKVVASCSERSSSSVKDLGAVGVFDYHLSLQEQLDCVDQITSGAKVTKIFDATSADDPLLAKKVFEKAGSSTSKGFATTNDWSSIGDFEGGTTHEIHLGLLGRPDAVEINNDMEKMNQLLVALFEAGIIRAQEHEVIGEGGLEDAIKAYKHKAGSRKVVVKIQDEQRGVKLY